MPDAPVADRHLRRLWITLAVVVIGSFAALLYYGGEVYQEAPPIPAAVVTTDGQSLFTGDQILAGQDVWRSIGGQELGSIWGHGAYTAPDWTADWLHREAIWILAAWATRDYGQTYESLNGCGPGWRSSYRRCRGSSSWCVNPVLVATRGAPSVPG